MNDVIKYLYLKFENNEIWEIDTEYIAESRMKYLVSIGECNNECDYIDEYNYFISNEDELKEWLYENMEWDDCNVTYVDTINKCDYNMCRAEIESDLDEFYQ